VDDRKRQSRDPPGLPSPGRFSLEVVSW